MEVVKRYRNIGNVILIKTLLYPIYFNIRHKLCENFKLLTFVT